ncbi:3-oxo-tetronate kinase [Streptomyces sp. NPDC048304]|uniref:3-oxo-tetronate kinase n=1 Tax=Streptomyces sp. NPDC048304 TaxID=3154820 RepID=UPI0033DB186E
MSGERDHPVWGCIADDFTGGTDIAAALVAAGYRTTLTVGVPERPLPHERDTDAVVVALKSRTAPRQEAVTASLAALHHLTALGCERYWFKYCSTFDSTPEGNIGPVTEALLDVLGEQCTVLCPAYPVNGRTVYQGHLFVDDTLLSDSAMRHHPLTPMTDSDLRRVLAAQSTQPVGLLPHAVLRAPEGAARAHLDRLTAQGVRLVIADTTGDEDLPVIERATRHLRLITGGSGLAHVLPPPRAAGMQAPADRIEIASGPAAVLAGSVSAATLEQTAHARRYLPHRKLPWEDLHEDSEGTVAQTLAWARDHLDPTVPVLLHSADDRVDVARAQHALGATEAAALVERALAHCARGLLDAGVRRLIVAGGETSGAVVSILGLQSLQMGPAAAPGVPWTSATYAGHTVNLALKSGNFGAPDFFTTAQEALK